MIDYLKATIGALGYLSSSGHMYKSQTILVLPTCKREHTLDHARLIAKVVKACKAYAPGTLWSIASDGESCHGAALAELTLKHPLSPTSRIHPLLSPLPNFNLLVGDNDVMCDKDYKHLYKRLRTLLLQFVSFPIFHTTITPQLL